MTTRDFNPEKPQPGYEKAPRITAAQMDRFLYMGLGAGLAKKVAALINESQRGYGFYTAGIDFSTDAPEEANYNPEGYPALTQDTALPGAVVRYIGWKHHHGSCPRLGYETTIKAVGRHGMQYRCEMDRGGVVENQNWHEYSSWVLVKPAEPKYLPIKRKVRPHDLEVGCVLRYCGNRPGTKNSGTCGGELKLGAEHRVTRIRGDYVFLDIPGWGSAEWTDTGLSDWEFVSNPNYVHGFRIGETVYSTGGSLGDWGASSGFGPYTVKAAVAPGETYGGLPYEVLMECGSEFPASLLTRDPTKAYGYKAPVEYKVKDGVAKEGDVIWWLASDGDPEKVIVGGPNWYLDETNVKGYPDAYQLREPQKVWDYKAK